MNIFCILYLVRENECVPTWRHHGRFLFVVDVMVLVRYGSLLLAKKRIVLFVLYAHVSCMLVLWPKHVHCLVLKQKQEITQGNNFYVPPKIIQVGHFTFIKPYPDISTSGKIGKSFEHEFNGFSRNGFPQSMRLTIRILLFFCVPFKKRFCKAQAKKKHVCFVVLQYLFCTPQPFPLKVGCTLPSSMIADDRHPNYNLRVLQFLEQHSSSMLLILGQIRLWVICLK